MEVLASPLSNPVNLDNETLAGAGSLPSGYAGADTDCVIITADSNGGEILIRDSVTSANEGLFNVNVKLPHSGPQMFVDSDGALKWNAQNLIHYSNDLTNWGQLGGVASTATTVTDDSTAYERVRTNLATVVTGQQYLVKFKIGVDAVPASTRFGLLLLEQVDNIYLTFDTSTGDFLGTGGAGSWDEASITRNGDDWDVRLIFTADQATARFELYPAFGANADLTTQLAAATGTITATNFSMSPYPCKEYHIVTTSAAIYHQPVEHDSSGNVNGFRFPGARTNEVLYSNDLTNAAWVKTNVTAAMDETGPDGLANSASKLTATAANGTALQTITLASSSRKQSAWVKRITGSGTINMTTDGGTTWGVISPTTSWSRLDIAAQTVTNPEVGFRIVTSGDEIAVAFVQNETSVLTPEIPTYAASGSASAMNLSITDSNYNHNDDEGTLLIIADTSDLADGGHLASINDGTDTNRAVDVQRSGSDIVSYNTVIAGNTTLGSNPAAADSGMAIRYKATDHRGAINGTSGTQVTTAGAMSSAPDRIEIGHANDAGHANVPIKVIAYFSPSKSDTQQEALSA